MTTRFPDQRSPSRSRATVGRVLGDFLLLEKLGEGGASAVFRAQQQSLSRDAVVKVLRTDAGNVAAKEQFLREASVATQLDHPYAAHVYAFGVESDGLMWLAMELVRGVSLHEMIEQRGPLPLRQFVSLFEHLCEVVQTAHDQGIAHRDIKPANVMIVARAGRLLPKLLDFGIAGITNVEVDAAQDRGRPSPVSAAVAQGSSSDADSSDGVDPRPAKTSLRQIIGTPCYMSPEQWLDPTSVDLRTDIYALGVLAFEVLVGEPPFSARSLEQMARMHVDEPPPHLGSAFPRALDEALRKALAKRKEERFESALELGKAVRTACGLADEATAGTPRLDTALFDEISVRAPLPIAAAAVVVQWARNFDHARSALLGLLTVWCRVCGILALASRSSGMRTATPLDARVSRRLADLRERDLQPVEWVELAHLLCNPWSDRPELHPLPELVEFLHASAGEPQPIELVEKLYAALSDSTSDPVATVHEGIEGLNGLLTATKFLFSYTWLVPELSGASVWMGLQAGQQPQLIASASFQDHPFVVSSDGIPVVSLGPLVEAVEPHPGAARKLFLFAGPSRSGARLVAEPHGFAHDSDDVWPFLANLIGDTSQEVHSPVVHTTPYKGLSSFGTEDHELFFGREREIQAALNRLKTLPLLALVGPSGSGKSSLAYAGIVPRSFKDAKVIRLRPGRKPLEAIAVALGRAGFGVSAAAIALAPEGAAGTLMSELRKRSAPTVIVVDQFEELFTLGADPVTKARFAAFLAGLTDDPVDPVRIIITLRDDFLIQTEQLTPLRGRIAYGLQLLTTPQRDDLVHIVQEPARRLGYRFEDDELVEEMVSEVEGRPGALALLSFAAAQLWERRDVAFRRLLRRAYRDLGGVGGALAQHAEQTLSSMDASAQALVRQLFRYLVTTEGTRSTLTRAEVRELFGSAGELLLDRLCQARLLVASEDEEGLEDRIEISHEALLSAWPRLVAWQREDRDGVRFREQLRSAARQWNDRGRPQGLLWRGDALAEFQLWRTRHQEPITGLELAFARASEVDSNRSRRTQRALVATTMLALSTFAGLVSWQRGIAIAHQRAAEEQRNEAQAARARAEQLTEQARANVAEMLLENARREAIADEPVRALAYVARAHEKGARSTALEFLLRRALDASAHRITAFAPYDGTGVRTLVSHANLLASGTEGGTVRVWDTSGTLLHELRNEQRVSDLEFDSSGRYLLATVEDAARIWDLRSGDLVTEIQTGNVVWGGAFSPDARRIVLHGHGESNSLWSFPEGQRIDALPHPWPPLLATYSRDGRLLVTGGWGGARIWSSDTGKLLHTLETEHPGTISKVAFNPSGTAVVTAQVESETRVWSTTTGKLLAILDSEPAARSVADVSPDGSLIVTGRSDGIARVYDATTFARLHSLEKHDGDILHVIFTPDSARIITAGQDGLVRVWDARTGERLSTFGGHGGPITALALDDDGQSLYTGGGDGQVLAWNLQPTDPAVRWKAHDATVWQVTYNHDGTRLLTAAADGRVRVWDRATLQIVHEYRRDPVERYRTVPYAQHLFAAWHPDERHVAIADEDDVVVWDLQANSAAHTIDTGGQEIFHAEWNRDGSLLALAGQSGSIYVWDRTALRSFDHELPKHDTLWSVRFSPDGSHLLSLGETPTAQIWRVADGELAHQLQGHAGALVRGGFDSSGTRVVTTSHDKTARVWDALTGEPLLILDGHRSYLIDGVFSPDGQLIATISGDGEIIIWEAATGRLLWRHRGDTLLSVTALTFSPAGTELVTAGDDGVVRIWDVRRAPVPSASELEAYVRCHVPFQFDGERLSPDTSLVKACAQTRTSHQ